MYNNLDCAHFHPALARIVYSSARVGSTPYFVVNAEVASRAENQQGVATREGADQRYFTVVLTWTCIIPWVCLVEKQLCTELPVSQMQSRHLQYSLKGAPVLGIRSVFKKKLYVASVQAIRACKVAKLQTYKTRCFF